MKFAAKLFYLHLRNEYKEKFLIEEKERIEFKVPDAEYKKVSFYNPIVRNIYLIQPL